MIKIATVKELKALVAELKRQELAEYAKIVKADAAKIKRLQEKIDSAEKVLASLDKKLAVIDEKKITLQDPKKIAANRLSSTPAVDPDALVKELQEKLLKNQADLARIDAAQKRLDELKARPKGTAKESRENLKELKALRSEIIGIPKPPTVASATTEARYADELAEQLEKAGLRLKAKLPAVAEAELKRPRSTTTSLRQALADELLAESKKMASPMAKFLQASIGDEFIEFAKADYGIVYGSADDIVAKVVRNGPKSASEYSGTLSRFILDQVDKTQDRSSYLFTRHVEARGCKWCRSQVSVYELTRQFSRHSNCRCMKIRRG